jgi:hypothetical protein
MAEACLRSAEYLQETQVYQPCLHAFKPRHDAWGSGLSPGGVLALLLLLLLLWLLLCIHMTSRHHFISLMLGMQTA